MRFSLRKILILLLIIFSLEVFVRVYLTLPSATRAKPIKSDTSEEILKKDIRGALRQANYCNTSRDCTVVSYGCLFGCYNLVNINYNLSEIQKANKRYSDIAFPRCIHDCIKPPNEEEIVCVLHKCVDTRRFWKSFRVSRCISVYQLNIVQNFVPYDRPWKVEVTDRWPSLSIVGAWIEPLHVVHRCAIRAEWNEARSQ